MFDSIGPQGAPKVAREFWVEQREAPFMYEGVLLYSRANKVFACGVRRNGKLDLLVLSGRRSS